MQRNLFILVAFLAVILVLAALWMAARQGSDYEPEESYPLSGKSWPTSIQDSGFLPLREILRRLNLPRDSRILEVEMEEESGRLLYEVEVLVPGGRILEFYVDPRTGETVHSHPD